MIIDTHAHLYWDSFKDDFDEVIQRSLDAGVTTIINVGVDVEKSEEALRQAQRISGERSRTIKLLERSSQALIKAYSTIGLHPHEVLRYTQGKLDVDVSIQQDILVLEQIYQRASGKIVAVGECGLDYFFDHPGLLPSPISLAQAKDLQRQLFQAQIDLAKKLNLPLIVHCRDDRSKDPQNSEAWDEVLQMIDDHPTILHCYSGLPETTQKVLLMPNTYVSFAGNLTYPKNEYLRQALKIIPLEKILVETDCPFLPPQSKRGQRNEPAYITEVVQTIAEIKNLTLDKVEKVVYNNTKQLLKV